MLRYRSGVDRRTGQIISGWAHCAQSIDVIWSTLLATRVMRLDFGSEIVRLIGRSMTPRVALELYRDMVSAVHRHEPEYRVVNLAVVDVGRTGSMTVRSRGVYYPEGRFGNYRDAEFAETLFVARMAA